MRQEADRRRQEEQRRRESTRQEAERRCCEEERRRQEDRADQLHRDERMDTRLERILTSSANKKTEDPQPFLQQGQRQHDFQVKTQKLQAIQTA